MIFRVLVLIPARRTLSHGTPQHDLVRRRGHASSFGSGCKSNTSRVPLRGRASPCLESGWGPAGQSQGISLIDKCTPASLRALAMFNQRRWAVALLGATIVTFLMAASADAATLKPNRVDVEYVPPKSSAHDALYKLVQERRVLEKIRDLLIPFRLPRRLLLKAQGCDGVVNAWYDDGVITVCYEYLDWVWQSAPEQTTPAGITPIDALAGPVVQLTCTKPDTQCLTS